MAHEDVTSRMSIDAVSIGSDSKRGICRRLSGVSDMSRLPPRGFAIQVAIGGVSCER